LGASYPIPPPWQVVTRAWPFRGRRRRGKIVLRKAFGELFAAGGFGPV